MEFEWDVESTSAVTIHKQVQGMTLRDWFAGMAVVSSSARLYTPEGAASWAYKVADAMITARSK